MEEKILTTHVRGIYCRQCPEWIVDDLLHTRGVLDAAVSFWRAELTVRYDPQIVTEAELRRVLADCGYPACEKGAPGSNPLRNALKSALGRGPERGRCTEVFTAENRCDPWGHAGFCTCAESSDSGR